jgi:hypothetical protein
VISSVRTEKKFSFLNLINQLFMYRSSPVKKGAGLYFEVIFISDELLWACRLNKGKILAGPIKNV